MAAVENLRASKLLEQRALHIGREIATPAGWNTIRDITEQPVPDGGVIVTVSDDELFFWAHKPVSVRNHTPLDTGNCFGVHNRGVVVETHPDWTTADYAARDTSDACSTSAQVVLVCPVHPDHLADEWCPCTDADLPAVLAAEDRAEDGGLRADDRRTCHTCKTWATDAHLNSPLHQALIDMAAERTRAKLLTREAA